MAGTVARPGIVIHTGAGNFTRASLGERETAMTEAMSAALTAGHTILSSGGSSLDAVQAAIVVLEDSPHFNAGKGAVFTHEGTNERVWVPYIELPRVSVWIVPSVRRDDHAGRGMLR